jgi:hypothetical protein
MAKLESWYFSCVKKILDIFVETNSKTYTKMSRNYSLYKAILVLKFVHEDRIYIMKHKAANPALQMI